MKELIIAMVDGLSILYILTFIGLIGTLVYVFIEGYPLWSINVVLITTILYLVFGILIADRKDGKRLILWGGIRWYFICWYYLNSYISKHTNSSFFKIFGISYRIYNWK